MYAIGAEVPVADALYGRRICSAAVLLERRMPGTRILESCSRACALRSTASWRSSPTGASLASDRHSRHNMRDTGYVTAAEDFGVVRRGGRAYSRRRPGCQTGGGERRQTGSVRRALVSSGRSAIEFRIRRGRARPGYGCVRGRAASAGSIGRRMRVRPHRAVPRRPVLRLRRHRAAGKSTPRPVPWNVCTRSARLARQASAQTEICGVRGTATGTR